MLALAFLLSQVPSSTEQIAGGLFRADMKVFLMDEKNFGIWRIPPKKVGSHFITGPWRTEAVRYLVGNLTKRLTAEEFRVQYVARYAGYERRDASGKLTEVPADSAPAGLGEEQVKKLIRLHFGSDFRAEAGSRDVFGYQIPASEKCLSCHMWAKKGDTLGYLVYGIEKKKG